jgi:hypothetical protein
MFQVTLGKVTTTLNNLKDREYQPRELTQKIRKQFPATDFLFYTKKSNKIDPNQVIVSGCYDADSDNEQDPCIEINLNYAPNLTVDTGKLDRVQLAFDIAECVHHELVHRDQNRHPRQKSKISKKLLETSDEHAYLGDADEIEAYGFSIAAEMHIFKISMHQCSMYTIYNSLFEGSAVMPNLEKHIKKYFKILELEDETK